MDPKHLHTLHALAAQHKLDVRGGRVRRTSSRFCLGVEHGDYNGTSLFGVGTDRGGRRGTLPRRAPRSSQFRVERSRAASEQPIDGGTVRRFGQI